MIRFLELVLQYGRNPRMLESDSNRGDMSPSPSRSPVQRIVVVDDHELVRLGVGQLIGQQSGWELSGEAADAESALTLIRRIKPDLAVIDLRLGGADGLSLIREIRSNAPSVKILVSSMQDEDLFAERCIRAGALGYISKRASVQLLLEAIARVLQGNVYLTPELMQRTFLRSVGHRSDSADKPLQVLSDREMEVFERFGEGKNVKQIGYELHISAKTVEYHRQHIKEKLNLSSSNAVVRMATMYALGSDCDAGTRTDA